MSCQHHQKISRRERDMAIYVEVVCYYHKQSDVARKFGLTQARVSQIVNKMLREQTQLEEQIGQPLGRASQRLVARQADRICKQQALSWCQRHLEDADKPLTTTRTRTAGEGKTLFTDQTVREVKPNLQLPKLMVRLSSELAAEADLPPPPTDDERRTATQRRRQIKRLEEENALAELTQKAEQLAEDAKARQAEQEKKMRIALGCPEWFENLSTPERCGQFYARHRLDLLVRRIKSLADVEVSNYVNGLSDGYVYPSYFEKSDENINGVRVARWVREVVPEPFLPKDDEAFLPEFHYLKDWDPSLRELVPYPTTWRIDGHYPRRFGRLLKAPTSGRGDCPPDAGPAETPDNADRQAP